MQFQLRTPFLVLFCLFPLSVTVAQPFDSAPRKMTVASWNVEWMYDDYKGDNFSDLAKEQSAPSKEYWEAKLTAVAEVLAKADAHIIALQEIEGDQTLAAIGQQLREKHQQSFRIAFVQGTDRFTEQDVGVLVRNGMVGYGRKEQSKTMFDSNEYYNLSKHLFVDFRWSDVESPLTLMNVHFRATADAEESRMRQAKLAKVWLQPALERGEDVIILGDFNSEADPGKVEKDIAALAGTGSTPGLVDLLTKLEQNRTATHLILDRQFDRIMVSPSMLEDGPGLDWSFESIRLMTDEIVRGERDGQEHWDRRMTSSVADGVDVSDHFPVVATFKLQ